MINYVYNRKRKILEKLSAEWNELRGFEISGFEDI